MKSKFETQLDENHKLIELQIQELKDEAEDEARFSRDPGVFESIRYGLDKILSLCEAQDALYQEAYGLPQTGVL